MDRGDLDGAKLHFAEKQMKLTENKENGKPVLAARTTAKTEILTWKKAKSPGKKLKRPEKVKPIQSQNWQKKTIDSWALQAPIIVSRKRREV